MGLEINGKTLIFLEETVFKTKEFVTVLEMIINNPSSNQITVIYNKGIKNAIENSISVNPSLGHMFDGYIDVIEQSCSTLEIDTENYFNFQKVGKHIKKEQFEYAVFITQKESVYRAILELKEKYDFISIVKIKDNMLLEWELHKKTEKAFYVDEDIYRNLLGTHNIEYVFSPRYGYLRLYQEAIYEGGEGFIYRTYSNQLVKIYHEQHLTYINQKRLLAMLEIDVFNPYINWPKDVVYYNNCFAGYLMDEIKDAEQLEDIRADGFSNYEIFERYRICHNFIKHMLYLHQKNIIVGDLKLDNILVRDCDRVYMIDCGSYQISDYPCVVYHPEYSPKIYDDEELKTILRTAEDEYFAINTIMFEILTGKKPNYDRNAGDIDSNRRVFHYPPDVSGINNNSHDDLKLWAMMTPKMREMFYYYFTQNKVSYLSEWISEIKLVVDSIKK